MIEKDPLVAMHQAWPINITSPNHPFSDDNYKMDIKYPEHNVQGFLINNNLKLKDMGSKVIAICKCGVDKDILIGGGMATFKFQCYFPCLCLDCKDVVQVNIKGTWEFYCPDCDGENLIPYNDDRLCRIKGDREIIKYYSGKELILTNGTYYCGRCDKPELRFQSVMFNWD